MNDGLIKKFQNALQEALDEKKIAFPDDVKEVYADVEAYRVLSIVNGEPPQITREAFASQMELKKLYPGKRNFKDYDENDISSYSCSLFSDIKTLNRFFKLPKQSIPLANFKDVVKFDGRHIICLPSSQKTKGGIRRGLSLTKRKPNSICVPAHKKNTNLIPIRNKKSTNLIPIRNKK